MNFNVEENGNENYSSVCPYSDDTENDSRPHFENETLEAFRKFFKRHSFVFKTKEKGNGQYCWDYILIHPFIKEMYFDQCKRDLVDIKEYGKILYSGRGENPPPSIRNQVLDFDKKASNYLFIIKQKHGNMNIYHYVLIDPDKKKLFLEKSKAELSLMREIENCGKVLYSGWGQDPPESISHRVQSAYFCTNERELKEEFSNITAEDSRALHDYARNGKLEALIRILIRKGCDVNSADKNGWTSLHHASYAGQLETIKYLISSLANIHVEDIVCGRNPVHIAAREGHTHVVEFFLMKSAKVDVADKNGWTPLHYAVWGGHLRTLRFLIHKGADINAKETVSGKKPIHIAAERGYRNIVKWFLRSGVHVDDTDTDGCTSLYYGVSGGHLEVVKYLADEKANIHAENVYGMKPIHLAAMNGDLNIIKFLLDQGVNVNDCNKNKATPLHYAAEHGQLKIVQFLINKGADIEARSTSDETPLDTARKNWHKKVVMHIETCLRNRQKSFCSVHSSSEDIPEVQELGLCFESQCDALAALKISVNKHSSIYKVTGKDRGRCAWHYVLIDNGKREMFLNQSKTGSIDVADYGKILCSAFGENPPQNIRDRYSELYEKVTNGLLVILKEKCGTTNLYHYVLIDADKKQMVLEKYKTLSLLVREIENFGRVLHSGWGQDPPESIVQKMESAYFRMNENFQCFINLFKDSQALQDAARNGELEALRGFIKDGLDINSVDKNGWTPLHHAACAGHLEIVKHLVSSLANIHVEDNICGRKPIHIAAREGHTDVVEFFLIKSAKVDAADKNGWMPLHYAAWGGHLSTLRFLIKKGADINAKEILNGRKPIHIAAQRGYMNIVKLFLRLSVSIEDTDRDGRTPLYYSVWAGHLEVVKDLAYENANIHVENAYGTKPIHLAAMEGHQNIIKFLLDRGANVNDCSTDKITPLHCAAECGHLEAVQFLINKGANIEARDNSDKTPLEIAKIKGHKEIVTYIESQSKNMQKS